METAYALFTRHGIRGVGIDRIIAESGVAKMTFYRHFPSKDDLVMAFLDLRERRWTREWLQVEVERLASTPRERLLSFFDAMDPWFRREDYESCPFARTLLEISEEDSRVRLEAVARLEVVRKLIADYAREAEFPDPEAVAYQIQILLLGAILSASRGDRDAARRARAMAELLVAASR